MIEAPPADDELGHLKTASYVIGIDDVPFDRRHRGDVAVVGAVFNGPRLEGVVKSAVRRDGVNATGRLAEMIETSRFAPSLQAVLLQGVTLAGFNVVDLHALHARLRLPVVAICRQRPDRERIRSALLGSVAGGRRKWTIIERLQPARPCRGVYAQSAGLAWPDTEALVERFAVHSLMPEPLRTAHLIAAALGHGASRQRV